MFLGRGANRLSIWLRSKNHSCFREAFQVNKFLMIAGLG
jgi:hypothetical protein